MVGFHAKDSDNDQDYFQFLAHKMELALPRKLTTESYVMIPANLVPFFTEKLFYVLASTMGGINLM